MIAKEFTTFSLSGFEETESKDSSQFRQLSEPKYEKHRGIFEYFKEKKIFDNQVQAYFQSLGLHDKNTRKQYLFESLIEEDRALQIGDKLVRVYYLANLPHFVMSTSLFRLINLPLPMSISYHIRGTNKGSMIKAARQRQSVLESSQNSRMKNGKSSDPDIARELEDLSVFINDLVRDQEKIFYLSIYVSLEADTKEDLLELDRRFQNATQDIEFTFNTYSFAQKKAYESIFPAGNDLVKEEHLLQTSAVINVLPFLTRNLNDPSGIFLGVNHYNNSLILIDLFKARNANLNIFGTSGSGKSVTAKLVLTRLALRGVQNIVIDPEGEYGDLVETLGGKVFKFANDRGIDPFIMLSAAVNDINDRVQILKHFFAFFVQDKNQDSSELDQLLMRLYSESPNPSMGAFLELINNENTKLSSGLSMDLKQLGQGSIAGLFNHPQIIELGSQHICFDLSGLYSEEQKIPMMYLIGSLINHLIDRADQRRMIFIDEAHKMLINEASRNFYVNLVKTARKRKAGVVTITQNLEDFKESDSSKTILTQAETTILLKQAPASVNFINRFNLFKLTEHECSDLGVFNIGEALFIREREHIYLEIFPFPSEKEIVFT